MNKRVHWAVTIGAVVLIGIATAVVVWKQRTTVDDFMKLLDRDPKVVFAALDRIESNWHPGNAIMLLECLQMQRYPTHVVDILELLHVETGQSFGYERGGDQQGPWYEWVWQQDYHPHPDYAAFKARLYHTIDPRFAEFFAETGSARIRLDEIVWGGVPRDGIPPLKNPKMLPASQASDLYLDDTNVVFALEVNGDARAYPKRILAHHEMLKDTIGGKPICGVYCTLCGSMIAYVSELDSQHFELGTSGFLYRANKLMYDSETKSFWSTLTGEPVVGPLVGRNLKLKRHHVITTTWGEWRRRHPETQVLSLDTGHLRDYREGAAYAEYFATDELMFNVPRVDSRLKNKDEVLALRFDEFPSEQLAIWVEFLDDHPLYHDRIGKQEFVVITDASGANRVYEVRGHRFTSWDNNQTLADEKGQKWKLSESGLKASSGETLARLPAHRAFWFGWFAAYPDTRLVSAE